MLEQYFCYITLEISLPNSGLNCLGRELKSSDATTKSHSKASSLRNKAPGPKASGFVNAVTKDAAKRNQRGQQQYFVPQQQQYFSWNKK